MLDTFAPPVALPRRHVGHTTSDDRVELHEMEGVPGFMVFRCERLHLELTPNSCARSYRTPRNEACVDCPIGARHERVALRASAPQKRADTRPSLDALPDESDIQDRLNRRAALRATDGQSGALSCIRCEKTAITNERLIGRMRLVRAQTICVSCYNREKEVLRGANAKGARPKKWAGRLLRTQIVCVEGGDQKRIPMGLSTGVDEAQRYAARVHPKARVVGVFVADDFHLLIAPHSEELDRAKWQRRERIAARKKAQSGARRAEQTLDSPKTADRPPPRKLTVGTRFGRLELRRDIGRGKWACVCRCGRQTVQHATTLRGQKEPSCGCTARASDFSLRCE